MCLKSVNAILARSADDADAYIQLGAPADAVNTIGNIKFANMPDTEVKAIDLGRPYVLAASTHDNEEQQLAEIWQNMGKQTQGRLLVIAPRHPQRKDDILRQLKNHNLAVRSENDAVTASTQIYLADTLGELEGFMLNADCIFMGGSLIPHGGQNILEPARLGKPIVFGPHMSNFAEETQLLLDAGGAMQVADKQALQALLSDWLTHPERAASCGQQAAQLMARQNTVLDRYLQAINTQCNLASPPSH
jgi:3-deoxy-D-manno-octulosonic-acid transferase